MKIPFYGFRYFALANIAIQLMTVSLAEAATFRVSNSQQLLEALSKVKGGDVVNLSSGQYANIIVRSTTRSPVNPTSPVVIQSENPGAPATFNRFEIVGASNLVLQDLRFLYSLTRSEVNNSLKPFRLEGGLNIVYRRVKFVSSYDSRGVGLGYGLNFKTSNKVLIESCTFDKLYYAMQIMNSQNVTIRKNKFTNIGHDALQIGMTQDLLIESNSIHMKSDPNILHKDIIQIHNTGTGLPSARVTIRQNTMYAPGSSNNVQGIYAGNSRATQGSSMYYKDFLIEDNEISSGHVHGISIGQINGLSIRSNRVLKDPSIKSTASVVTPTVRVQRASTDVSIKENTLEKAPIAALPDNNWSSTTVPSAWIVTPNYID